MDTFLAIARRLTFFSVVVLAAFFGVLHAPLARASSNTSYDAAYASCTAAIAGEGTVHSYTCQLATPCVSYSQAIGLYMQPDPSKGVAGGLLNCFPFSGSPPAACSGMVGGKSWDNGSVLVGSSICVNGPVIGGASTMCGMTVTPVSPPTMNSATGQWQTETDAEPTGQPCSVGSGTTAGTIIGPDGGPGEPIPSAPNPPPTPQPDPQPSVCNTAACFNPESGQFCAQDASGANVACVSAPTSSPTAGGCATSGDVTLCAGSPTPPLPGASSGITDPSTQINASGSTTQANPSTGAAYGTGVTVYSGTGGSTSNGGTSTSGGSGPVVSPGSGPASGSSAPASPSSSSGSFSGGTSCTTPPACSGDAVMCGIARTQWSTTCQLHTDLDGPTGAAPSSSSGTTYSQSDIWVTPTAGNTVGDAANAGNYDESGGGGSGVCPLHNFTFTSVHGVTVPFELGCDPLHWLALVGLAFTLYRAARITAGSAI